MSPQALHEPEHRIQEIEITVIQIFNKTHSRKSAMPQATARSGTAKYSAGLKGRMTSARINTLIEHNMPRSVNESSISPASS